MRLGAHLHSFRYPCQGHRRFLSQSPRDGDFSRIPLAPLRQCAGVPLAPLQFLRHDPLGLRFRRFPQLLSVMPVASLGVHRRQQFFLERSLPEKPAPADWLVVVPILCRAPSLQRFLQSSPARRAVFGVSDSLPATVLPSTNWPFARRPQMLRPTAPAILPQGLLR